MHPDGMGEQRPTRIVVVAVIAAAVMLINSTFGSEGPTAEAAKKKQKVEGLDSAIVACPASVGGYKLDEVGATQGSRSSDSPATTTIARSRAT